MTVYPFKARASQLTQSQLREIIDLQALLGSAEFNLKNFMEMVNVVVDRVRDYTDAKGAAVELVEGDEIVYHAASGSVIPFIGVRLDITTSLSGLCVQKGEITISEDTSKDHRVDLHVSQEINAASMVVVPLSRKGNTFGVLKVISDRPNAFDEYNIYTLQLLAGLLGGALGQQLEIHQTQQMEKKLRHQAQYDSLTGLPNRALFNDRLSHAIARHKRSDTHIAVMYMDIDHFKSVNDTHGHAAGDALLKEFASRINATVRASDTFARLGGDEFVLIAEHLKSGQEARHIAAKILDALSAEFTIGNMKLKVGASIGIAISSDKNILAEKLLQEADSALYKVKKAGRNGFELLEASA